MLLLDWNGNFLDNYIPGLKIATMVIPVTVIIFMTLVIVSIAKYNQILSIWYFNITCLAITYFSLSIVPMVFNIFIYPVETTVIISYIAATICVIHIMKEHCCHNRKCTSFFSIFYGLVIFISFSITFLYLIMNLLRNSQNFTIHFVLAFVLPVSILAYQVWKKSGDKKSEKNSEECELKEVVTCREKPKEQKGKSSQNQ